MQLNMPNGPHHLGRAHETDPHASMVHSEGSGDDTVETCKMTAASAVIAVVLVLGAILAVGYVMPLVFS
ncbi:hypothetical protein MW7_003000 [Imbroritus primus]|jgi:hypothetical protein|uniref:Uncharacterized protein n=1 Tax=Imbroritus primus TaxID=3058603 RepID=A0ACD3SSQ5_9BURK|nr:hypothetical protein MW7_003000 [Burkholderiaceae bacterium PBA]